MKNTLIFISFWVGFILFYNWLLYGVFRKHQNESIDYGDVIQRGLSRFFPVLLGYLLMMLPFFIIAIIAAIFGGLAQSSELAATAMGLMLLILFTIASFFILYFIVGPLHIVAKKAGPISGLAQSWRLMRGHLFKTVLLVLILGILSGFLSLGLAALIGDFAIPLVTLIFAPLWASLIVVYNQDLENIAPDYKP